MGRLRRMPFVTKLILLVGVILTLALGTYSFQQIRKSIRIMEKDTMDNLSLLTEQVLANYRQNRDNLERQIYAAATTVEIPAQLRVYDMDSTVERRAEMQRSANQMVTNDSAYDFVLIQTLLGTEFHTGGKLPDGGRVSAEASQVLEKFHENTYGSCLWVRAEDGDIYVVKDIYSTSPMRRCGRMALRMVEDRLFQLSRQNQDMQCTMIFLDSRSDFSFCAGETITEGIKADAISSALTVRQGKVELDGQEYYMAAFTNDSLTAIGLIPTSHLYQANMAVMRSSLRYGALVLVLSLLLLMVTTRSFSHKMNALVESMDAVAKGDLECELVIEGEDDISQTAVHFNMMVSRIKELLGKVLEEQQLKSTAELKLLEHRYRTLQMQIKPHFVYNALESINALAKINGNEQISKMVQRISRYFRSITVNMDKQYITVEKEMKTLLDYADIYNDIYDSRLKIVISYEEPARQALISTMILQPIVENALVHGLSVVTENPTLTIKVEVQEQESMLITIENNGPAIEKSEIEAVLHGCRNREGNGSIGLANVQERIHLIYGGRGKLSICGGSYGTRVLISLPLFYMEPDEGMEEELFYRDESVM